MITGLIGAGAVGSSLLYFGAEKGHAIVVLGDPDRLEKYKKGIRINGRDIAVQVQEKKDQPLDILFLSVKSVDFEQAVENLEKSIDKKTIIVSLMNGVSTETELRKRFTNPVVHAVVRGSFSRGKEGTVFKEDQINIIIGSEGKNKEAVTKVEAFLKQISYPYILSEDIITNMWSKFCINVSENLIAAVLDFNYGQMKKKEILEAVKLVQREVVEVGRHYGAKLSEENISDNIKALIEEIDEGVPSTLQDLRAGRKTEVDLFAGEMIRLGEKAGIETPYSKLLYYLVKGKEQ